MHVVSPSDGRVLWWALEQQLWAISDLLRLAYATELLSGSDHMVLHGLASQLEYLVKQNKEAHRDIPTQGI